MIRTPAMPRVAPEASTLATAIVCDVPGRGLLALLLFAVIMMSGLAHAGAIVVGRSGTAAGCSQPTIQAAINKANTLPGYNLILVTDDVGDGVWHENLNFSNIRADVQIEIVGGFNNCTELAPTAFGKASLYGGDASRPSVSIDGPINLRLRQMWIQGGRYNDPDNWAAGIDFDGRGVLQLESVRIAQSGGNVGSGIGIRGSGGEARLELLGNVEVTDQPTFGIIARGQSIVRMEGDGNRIRDNGGDGVRVFAPAVVRIGGSGRVISNNRGRGLFIYSDVATTDLISHLYSTDPTDPLVIYDNDEGAILLRSTRSRYQLCASRIGVELNKGGLEVIGAQASLEINGPTCSFPSDAVTSACSPSLGCSRIGFNEVPNRAGPLVRATDGGSIYLARLFWYGNSASSLLSANLGTAVSASWITMSDSVVTGNRLRDNLFESLNGGTVDIWDSTVKDNTGGFMVSLVGINAALLRMTGSILDQPQQLLDLQGAPQSTRLDYVLALNQDGAADVPRLLLIGQPTYADYNGRLQPGSLGVDAAPARGNIDFDDHPRDIDTVGVPNVYGPRDLGAFEVQVPEFDRIFSNGFE